MSKAKGEVGFDADGERFTLSFSIDALCELEDAAGCSIAKIGTILADPDQPQLRIVKSAFWAALTDHHPDMTQKDASKLMASLGIVQGGSAGASRRSLWRSRSWQLSLWRASRGPTASAHRLGPGSPRMDSTRARPDAVLAPDAARWCTTSLTGATSGTGAITTTGHGLRGTSRCCRISDACRP